MEMTTIKTGIVFVIIFGCFLVLYPRIFSPMVSQILGYGGSQEAMDEIASNRMPPHLKQPGTKSKLPGGDDVSKHMRQAGAHPGLRAAAEMKKAAAAQTQGGGGKGMMGMVLPMYAVGIVVYLIYTLTKVFGGKKDKEKGDYLNSHFNDIQYDSSRQRFVTTSPDKQDNQDSDREEETISRRFKKGRRDLERLLLKADKNTINSTEITELKRRLLETEAQMSRILSAMETVHQQVGGMPGGSVPEADGQDEDGEWEDEAEGGIEEVEVETPDGLRIPSPDMDSYDIIKSSSAASSPVIVPTFEELHPDIDNVDTPEEVTEGSSLPEAELAEEGAELAEEGAEITQEIELPGELEHHTNSRYSAEEPDEELMSAPTEPEDTHPDLRRRVLPKIHANEDERQ